MKEKHRSKLLIIILIVVVTSIITSLTTGVIIYNNLKVAGSLSYIDISNDEYLQEFLEVYSSLSDDYYEDIDKSEMIESAIIAMFDYLGEDYSTYLSQSQTDELTQKLSGTYQGIGIEILSTNEIYSVFEGSPAEESGLQAGDIVTKVNDEEVGSNSVSDMIQNSETDDIKITVLRDEEELEFTVYITDIEISVITSELIEDDKKIGYISISTFSSNSASQFKTALESLESSGIDSLIIDVRDNSGGYLSAATEIINMFLENGKTIYSLEDKEDVVVYSDTTDEKREYSVVVLMNENSASASEVLAAALKDSYGAYTIGTTTFGKGKVQHTKLLDNGSMVKYTSSKWYTPTGVCLDGEGLTPDKFIIDDETTDIDEIKEAAIEYLLS